MKIWLIFFCTLFFACQEDNLIVNTIEKPIIINIQPLGDIGQENINYVYTEFKKIYPHIRLLKSIALPVSAYYKPRERYRADLLLDYLSTMTSSNQVTLGLTSMDISTTKDEIYDWGVMGLGQCPGKVCVASTFRLNKSQLLMQLFKVSIHEVGHTQGLPHCEVKSCFMRDAEGRNPTDEEVEFCPKCKAVFIKKGWSF
jgi:archaemetzincin